MVARTGGEVDHPLVGGFFLNQGCSGGLPGDSLQNLVRTYIWGCRWLSSHACA